MLPAFLIGLGLVALVWLGAGWFTRTPPRALLRGLRWTGLGLAGAALVALVLTGRLGWALAVAAGILPWILRVLYLLALGKVAHGLWRRTFGGGASPWPAAGGNPAPGDAASVDTPWLVMRLDLTTGTMSGTVRQGPLAGRALESLTDAELAALWRDTAGDADSRRLLASWLSRCRPQWEPPPEPEDTTPPAAAGPMDHAEALRVLGLPDGASPEAIRAAHRRLMAAVHPDHGGSDWLAAKLNQARDLLLNEP